MHHLCRRPRKHEQSCVCLLVFSLCESEGRPVPSLSLSHSLRVHGDVLKDLLIEDQTSLSLLHPIHDPMKIRHLSHTLSLTRRVHFERRETPSLALTHIGSVMTRSEEKAPARIFAFPSTTFNCLHAHAYSRYLRPLSMES